MKKLFMASFLWAISSLLMPNNAKAQGPIHSPSTGVLDGVYIPEHIPTKRCIPYPNVREADLIWSKRVWSYIDLREKFNHPLYYPLDEISRGGTWTRSSQRWSLWTVLREHILNGDLTIFSPFNPLLLGFGGMDGDQLKYPVKPQPGLNFYTDNEFRDNVTYYLADVGPPSTIPKLVEDPNDPRFGEVMLSVDLNGDTSIVYEDRDTTWLTSQDIVQYRIKEDWFFDKQRSVMERRIIAIAPVRYTTELVNGQIQVTGMEELFWIYFPHARFILNNYFVFNPKNGSQWMSFDELFWKRMFHSTIYKESNTMDRSISAYQFGEDALIEAEKIKEEIRNIEHDVWSY